MSSVVIKDEPVGPGGADGSPPAGVTDNSSVAQRPDHIPEKFWDAEKGEARYEDLAKSYTELEKKLGQSRAEQSEPAEPTQQQQEEGQRVANILEANGLDPQRFTIEMQQEGKLSDASYEELESKGFTREMVDQYLAGAGLMGEYSEVLTQAQLAEVYEVTGGEDGFAAMADWAAQNVAEKDLNTYNEMVNSGNPAQAKAAVAWMKSIYTDANGNEPNLLNGEGSNTPSVEPFLSNAQVMAAMRDSRYRSDPAYRAEVYARLKASNVMQ